MLKIIGKNAIWIVLIQAINFMAPIIALPHVTRVLGINSFGLYSIALTYGNYVLLISDFSFHVNGPLLISKALRENEIRSIFADSLFLKALLMIPSSLVFCVSISLVTHQAPAYVCAALAIPVATALIPRWVIYGMNKFATFAAASLLTKTLWVISLYWFVNGPKDLVLLLLLTAASQLALAIICIHFSLRNQYGRLIPEFTGAMRLLRRDLDQYVAMLAMSSLRDMGTILLSVFSGIGAVSIYALADRVRFAIMGVIAPFSQALFLTSVRYVGTDRAIDQKTRGAANRTILLTGFLTGAALALFSSQLASMLGGHQFSGAARLICIVAFVPTLTGFNSILGVNTLLAFGKEKEYAAVQLKTALISLPVLIALIVPFGAWGAAWAALATETAMALLLYRTCRHVGLLARAFSLT